MDVAGYCERERAYRGSRGRVARQERRLWMGLVQVLQDGE
jgi:hypothetical protein